MANLDTPFGFKPVRRLDGQKMGTLTKAYIPASDGTAVFVGDCVKHAGTSGAAGLVVQGEVLEGVPAVIRAAESDFDAASEAGVLFGVVVGFKPDPDNLMRKHRAASTNRIAYVCTDQNVVFEIQEDAAATPIVAASIGLNVTIVDTVSGSATTGVSGTELDSDSVGTSADLPLRLIGLSKKVGNAFNTAGADTDNAKFEVVFNRPFSMTPGTDVAGS
jgi:hypothetical protein